MARLLDLPKEIKKEKFEAFLEKIKRDFPVDQFPEIFVQYQEMNGKVVVLGLGKNRECATQTAQTLEKHPEFRGQKTKSRVLRAPKTKFVVR